MIDFKFMEALEAVVNEGGFEKASRVLHITQSAVSQRIKSLEEMSGQVLLIRKTPPVPTRAGARILKYFMQARQLEQELFEKLSPAADKKFKPLPLGINADSLATWFLDALLPFLKREYVTVDIRVDDQEQTLGMLRNGEVFGCISAHPDAIQGCKSHFLGSMTYRMLATPDFAQKWFCPSISFKTIKEAPLLVFNRKDELQARILKRAIKKLPEGIPIHYLPSSEKFLEFITAGMAYGMLPDIQSKELLAQGTLVEVLPGYPARVKLYWHCWNIKSELLEEFSRHLIKMGRGLLEQD